MAICYDTDEERKLHLNVIDSLADQYGIDKATLREIYERQLEDLTGAGARIRTYLSVLTARRVREQLDHRQPQAEDIH